MGDPDVYPDGDSGRADNLTRLAATLQTGDIHPIVAEAVALQLVGGTERDTGIGTSARRQIHTALITEAAVQTHHFLDRVSAISPTVYRMSGDEATKTGLVGQPSGDNPEFGPFLNNDIDLLVIEGDINSSGEPILTEVLNRGSYRFDRSNFRQTVETDTSLLYTTTLTSGNFDSYESRSRQLSPTAGLLAPMDICVLNTVTIGPPVETIAGQPFDSAVEAQSYLERAQQGDPTATDDALAAIDDVTRRLSGIESRDEIDRDMRSVTGEATVEETLYRIASACARATESGAIQRSDVDAAVRIIERTRETVWGAEATTGQFDADIVKEPNSETETTDSESSDTDLPLDDPTDVSDARLREYQRQIIQTLCDRHDDEPGAPVTEVTANFEELLGINNDTAESQLEKLRARGEIYEPQGGYIRTT